MRQEDTLTLMSSRPSIQLTLDNKRPSLKSAPTQAIFTTSTVLWSDPVVTWSDPIALWGGKDSKQSLGPSLAIDNKRPSLMEIGYPTEQAQTTIYLYGGMPMGLLMALTYDVTTSYNA